MTLKNQLENQPIRMGAWDDLVCGLDIGLGYEAWLKKPLGGVGWSTSRLRRGQPVIPERGLCFSKALLRAVGSIRIWSGKCPHRLKLPTPISHQRCPAIPRHTISAIPPIKVFPADLRPNNIKLPPLAPLVLPSFQHVID